MKIFIHYKTYYSLSCIQTFSPDSNFGTVKYKDLSSKYFFLAREESNWEKTVCKQITGQVFVPESVCLARMTSFSFIPSKMQNFLN